MKVIKRINLTIYEFIKFIDLNVKLIKKKSTNLIQLKIIINLLSLCSREPIGNDDVSRHVRVYIRGPIVFPPIFVRPLDLWPATGDFDFSPYLTTSIGQNTRELLR